jgi:hypothetical protein
MVMSVEIAQAVDDFYDVPLLSSFEDYIIKVGPWEPMEHISDSDMSPM